jgi:hypothetical protein
MRIPGTKVWRAFPELDPFDDARCIVFVRAASRPWRRVIRAGVVVLVAVVVAFVWLHAVMVFGVTGLGLERSRAGGASGVIGQLGLAIVLAVPGPFAGLLVRDMMLKRAIRRVLRTRGQCVACSYGLIGLRAGADGRVVCPECGLSNDTDEAMQSLASAGGDGVHAPRREGAPNDPRGKGAAAAGGAGRRWSRRPLVRRVVLPLTVVLVAFGLPGLWWLSVLRADESDRQYGRSRMPTVADLIAATGVPESEEPLGRIGGGFDRQASVLNDLLRLRGAFVDPSGLRGRWDRGELRVKRSMLLSGVVPEDPEVSAVFRERTQAAAERMIAGIREIDAYARDNGLAAELDRLAGMDLRLARPDFDSREDADVWVFESLLDGLIVFHRNRAILAVRRGDVDEGIRACESALRLAVFAGMQPQVQSRVRLLHAMCDAFDETRAILMLDLSVEQFERVASAIRAARQASASRRSWMELSVVRLRTLYAYQDFDRLSRVRNAWTWKESWEEVVRPPGHGRRALTQIDTAMIGIRRWLDASGSVATIPVHSMAMLPEAWSARESVSAAEAGAMVEFEFAVLELMIRIEEFRRAHGRLPTTLNELADKAGEPPPIEPISGKPLAYRVGTPGQQGMNERGYVLYSLGVDGDDDGGVCGDGSNGGAEVLRWSEAADVRPGTWVR